MSRVLVVNSGSSSIKYRLLDAGTGQVLGGGLLERLGRDDARLVHHGPGGRWETSTPVADHDAGMELVLRTCAEHGPELVEEGPDALAAVGHRVVQGGERFTEPALVDDDVERAVDELSDLAPLHNPPNLAGIRAARRAFPNTPHVAVFDTAFHHTLPPVARTYALDREVARRFGIRRYGFHGTSHAYVSRAAAALLGLDPRRADLIVLHLGNGASATAVRGGVSVETSMGLTPLEGLVMGTRSGDVDPAALLHLARVGGFTPDDLDVLLNRRSGLLGLAGHQDMRDLLATAGSDDDAALALDVYCHRIRHYVGAYLAQLGRADAVVFTAGVGENASAVRARALAGLEGLGITVDPQRNEADSRKARVISPDGSPIAVLVVPTDEELEIARQAASLVARV